MSSTEGARMKARTKMRSVSPENPCPVVAAITNAAWERMVDTVRPDQGEVPGFRRLGPSNGDEQFVAYRGVGDRSSTVSR